MGASGAPRWVGQATGVAKTSAPNRQGLRRKRKPSFSSNGRLINPLCWFRRLLGGLGPVAIRSLGGWRECFFSFVLPLIEGIPNRAFELAVAGRRRSFLAQQRPGLRRRWEELSSADGRGLGAYGKSVWLWDSEGTVVKWFTFGRKK